MLEGLKGSLVTRIAGVLQDRPPVWPSLRDQCEGAAWSPLQGQKWDNRCPWGLGNKCQRHPRGSGVHPQALAFSLYIGKLHKAIGREASLQKVWEEKKRLKAESTVGRSEHASPTLP